MEQTMPIAHIFDLLPLWGVFVVTFVLVFVSEEIGFRFGRMRVRSEDMSKDPSLGSMVGAILGLLAFMLAFTFGMAGTRYDTRRQLIRDEANAIQTAYLRADFVSEPRRGEIRKLLREYVDVRLAGVREPDPRPSMARSEEIQNQLWMRSAAEGNRTPGSIVVGLYINTLNEMIDLHTKRVQAGLRSRIPSAIIYVLYFVTILAMASVGYLAGLTGKRNHFVNGALVLAFSSVMLLIIDIDRPHEGLLRVNQQVLLDLQKKLAEPPP
jgi:hypothetical protein